MAANSKYNSGYKIAWKQANKLAMINYKGGACENCGETNTGLLQVIIFNGSDHFYKLHHWPWVTFNPYYGASWSYSKAFCDLVPFTRVICEKCRTKFEQYFAAYEEDPWYPY